MGEAFSAMTRRPLFECVPNAGVLRVNWATGPEERIPMSDPSQKHLSRLSRLPSIPSRCRPKSLAQNQPAPPKDEAAYAKADSSGSKIFLIGLWGQHVLKSKPPVPPLPPSSKQPTALLPIHPLGEFHDARLPVVPKKTVKGGICLFQASDSGDIPFALVHGC